MPRQSNADIVYAALPEMGKSPIQVQRLAQSLPLTIAQVTAALQVLKHTGRAINPRGSRTNYWTRYAEPVVEPEPAPEPVPEESAEAEPVQSDAEARVHEVERHLARIEGALAGISSRQDELLEIMRTLRASELVQSKMITALGEEWGVTPMKSFMGGVLTDAR